MSETQSVTIETKTPTGSHPAVPMIINNNNQPARPSIGVIPNPSTPAERFGMRGWDFALCLIPAYLLMQGKIPVGYGVALIGLLGGPPEIVRQIIKLMRVVNERAAGRRSEATAAAGSALALILAGYTQVKVVGGGVAFAAILAGACVGCSGVKYEREECTAPDTWNCIRDQPHLCSPETPPQWTPVGDRPCGETNSTCARNASGRTYCRPNFDAGAP